MPLAFLFIISLMASAGEIREAKNKAELESVMKSLQTVKGSSANTEFKNVSSGIPVPCATYEEKDGYEVNKIVDCTGSGETFPGGFRLRSLPGHPLVSTTSPYGAEAKPQRVIGFWSRNHALNETFISFHDQAGGPEDHDIKSFLILLPRKVIPTIEVRNDDIEVTLNTGEKVLFDKRTHAIKSGALKEGYIDITADRFRRMPPNIQYTGNGISIRLNHRFEDPFQSAEFAEVTQNDRMCRIPRSKLFGPNGKLLTNSDEELIRVMNQACPAKSEDQAFRI